MLLDLSKNELRSLPHEIGACQRLTDLYLDDNEIALLPDTIGKKRNFYFNKIQMYILILNQVSWNY